MGAAAAGKRANFLSGSFLKPGLLVIKEMDINILYKISAFSHLNARAHI